MRLANQIFKSVLSHIVKLSDYTGMFLVTGKYFIYILSAINNYLKPLVKFMSAVFAECSWTVR